MGRLIHAADADYPMFEQGQSLFATMKVDWLEERNQIQLYEIISIKTRSPGSNEVMVVEIELRRRDGQPDPWLQEQANLHANPNQ